MAGCQLVLLRHLGAMGLSEGAVEGSWWSSGWAAVGAMQRGFGFIGNGRLGLASEEMVGFARRTVVAVGNGGPEL